MPKSLYKELRSQDADDPNPIVMTKASIFHTSRQIWHHLLCAECEDRFNERGENWVLTQYAEKEGSFPLRETLLKYEPIWPGKPLLVYPARQIPEIDMGRLVYFAASVFWRAAIHDWGFARDSFHIELGDRYREEFRRYLMAESDTPENAVFWISVSARDMPLTTVEFPFGSNQGGYHQYRFAVPGISFQLFLGGRMPPLLRRTCTHRSPEGFIFLSNKVDERMLEDMVRGFGKARQSEKVKRMSPN